MTVGAIERKAGPYNYSDGAIYPFYFKVFSASDVVVIKTDSVGAESELVLNNDFTVSLNDNQDNNPGGNVSLSISLTDQHKITISSGVQLTQETVITNQAELNKAFDKLTILCQQLDESISRSVKVNVSSDISPDELLDSLYQSASSAAQSANAAASSAESASDKAASASQSAQDAANAVASIDVMSGATAESAGTQGLLPPPQAGDESKVFTGGGSWKKVSDIPEFTDEVDRLEGAKADKDLANVSQTGKDNTVKWGMPDYHSGINQTALWGNQLTAPAAGYIWVSDNSTNGSHVDLSIGPITFVIMLSGTSPAGVTSGCLFPVRKGEQYTATGGQNGARNLLFFPCIGG